jgi:Ca2+-binding EF-hand superfamily protein
MQPRRPGASGPGGEPAARRRAAGVVLRPEAGAVAGGGRAALRPEAAERAEPPRQQQALRPEALRPEALRPEALRPEALRPEAGAAAGAALRPEAAELQLALVASNQNLYEVSNRDLKEAFDFFDPDGEGLITLAKVRAKLECFYDSGEQLPLSELKFLMGSKHALTVKDLRKILDETAQVLVGTDVDPLRQAFDVFDPQHTGFVPPETLGSIMQRLGHGALTPEDLKILVETLDEDQDGRIGFDDFRHFCGLETKRLQRLL